MEWKHPHSVVAATNTERKMFSSDFPPSYEQRAKERGRARDCISGQCLLIGIQHTSPQLSQIAIEKWPVMQLLANPGPLLPSIIKCCLSRGPLSGLNLCVVSLSHLPATSSPAATAEPGQDFPLPLCCTYQIIWPRNWNGAIYTVYIWLQ